MLSLRERALAAMEQRDDLLQRKARLRLQEEIQKLFGISIPYPENNCVEVEGMWFRIGKESHLSRDDALLVGKTENDVMSSNCTAVTSLASLGDAIDWWQSVEDYNENDENP